MNLAYLPFFRGIQDSAPFGRAGGFPVDFGADPESTVPTGPPVSLDPVELPPLAAANAIRSQFAEAFRRAVWASEGENGWDEDARRAWARIAALPLVASTSSSVTTDPPVSFADRAVRQIPQSWIVTGDARAIMASATLGPMATVIRQRFAAEGPLAHLETLASWGKANGADALDRGVAALRAYGDGFVAQANQMIQHADDAATRLGTGLGFGTAIGVATVAAVAAAALFPEQTVAVADRAVSGYGRAIAKRRNK